MKLLCRLSQCRLLLKSRFLPVFVTGCMLLVCSHSLWAQQASGEKSILLTPDKETGFSFETSQLKGSIQPEGSYHGVNHFALKKAGRDVIDPRYSALNLFKLMAQNQYMGEPRKMERTVKVMPDALEITWLPTEQHKAKVVARYEVSGPASVDVTVTVHCEGTYPAYEIFMPSYFDNTLRPHLYLKQARSPQKPPDLVVPMMNDVYRGTLLVFPRDIHAARVAIDGRWDRNEFKAAVVPVTPVRHYAHCLAFLADAEKTFAVVVMAHPKDCYGISARYFANKPEDRLTSYSAVDFCMFGENMLPGKIRTTRLRLALTPLDESMSQPLKLYQEFLSSFDEK